MRAGSDPPRPLVSCPRPVVAIAGVAGQQQLSVGPGQAGAGLEPARDPTGSGHRQLEQDSSGLRVRVNRRASGSGRSRPDPARDCDRPAADRRPITGPKVSLYYPEDRHSPLQAPGRLHGAAASHGSGPRRSAGRPCLGPPSSCIFPTVARQGALRHPPRQAAAAGLPRDLPDAHPRAPNDGALVEHHVHRELGAELPARGRLSRLSTHASSHMAGRRRRDDREAGHETSGLCDPLAWCDRAPGLPVALVAQSWMRASSSTRRITFCAVPPSRILVAGARSGRAPCRRGRCLPPLHRPP